jgi:phenylacetic acid degradation operon negative regulatory protein
MKITPRKLILDLLLAGEGQPLSSREAVSACYLFQIGETSTRVALTRLLADGLIKSVERGVYQLGPNAIELAGEVAAWRTIDRNVREWTGDYITVFTATLGRTDRSALVRRERALRMLGFRELDKGYYIRPNNIDIDLNIIIQKLRTLGVEHSAIIATAHHFEAAVEKRIQQLWDGKALTKSYAALSKKLEVWIANADQLSLETAAQESLILGRAAIHQVVFDPLLPLPWVDPAVRNQFFQVVRHFDQVGKVIWFKLRQNGFIPD